MKGVIFTEFLQFVAKSWDENLVDDLLDAADLPSGGAYTTVGTYDHREIVTLLRLLSQKSGLDDAELLQRYGRHLALRFAQDFPEFFDRCACLFDFLASVDAYVHVEVRKLYPDAELPNFEILQQKDSLFSMIYRSARGMEALAMGLIEGAAIHYGVSIALQAEKRSEAVIFTIEEMAA
ncbi:heme NO-binding domain-containing protein [Allorhizobium sp. BGMRC 0089]|uniref:heme NO-binding domain-containing protein n=1 Tax=Allorhizobium sonneratiae TaxID=2934936 RepID=UPI00203330A5|nr:heme NO-binding domain-containing protein [Allorhizobium sonneratiae]MCM2291279.1 heme NO-binding domain-containing protein [Allorhizobium sonneratiae]